MIYFLQEAGNRLAPIKIGYTAGEPAKRLSELQTGYPGKLCVLFSREGTPEDESAEHTKWKHLNIYGEWFRPAPDLLLYIDRSTGTVERTIDEAREIALPYYDPPLHATGIRKRCPRCERNGWIFILTGPGDRALIVWDGPARWSQHYGRPEVDIDSCDVSELFDPQFGCGSDVGQAAEKQQQEKR